MRRDLVDHRVELCDIFSKEMTMWRRIALKATERGLFKLAEEIHEDIEKARRDMAYDEFFNQYRYKYLFML